MKHLVLYIDIQPNMNEYIAGIHGYLYTKDNINIKSSKRPNNTTMSNVGYLFKGEVNKVKHKVVTPSFFIDVYKQYKDKKDSVLFSVLENIYKYCKTHNITSVFIKTNEVRLIHLISKNIDEIKLDFTISKKQLDRLNVIKESDISFKYKRIYDYETNPGLQRALNSITVSKNINKKYFIKLSYPKYYWTPVNDRHDMLSFRHLLFVNNDTNDNTYYTVNYKKDDPIGLRTNYVVYSLVYLNTPVKQILYIKNIFKSILKDIKVGCTIHLDNLYKNSTLQLLQIYGQDALYTINNKRVEVWCIDDTMVANEIKPVGVSIHAVAHFDKLEIFRNKYHTGHKSNDIIYIDITDKIYDIDKKVKIKKEIKDNDKIKVPFKLKDLLKDDSKKTMNINLFVGIDIPKRNVLKRLENKNVKLTMGIYLNSGVLLEHYCFVEYDDGDAIFVNIYSNKTPIKI